MNKVNEMFGLYTNGAVFPDLHTALREQTCPYMNGAQCYKTRKSDPDTAMPTRANTASGSSATTVPSPASSSRNT